MLACAVEDDVVEGKEKSGIVRELPHLAPPR